MCKVTKCGCCALGGVNVLGFLNGIVVHMTYTKRGDDLHIISLRQAEKHEIKRFAQGLSR